MSASSKKKLRKEQEAAKLTEKQQAAQKEAKQLKLITVAFVAVLAVILVIAVTVGVNQTIKTSGYREKSTIALTVGDHEINSVEMNYFYMDEVENFYNNYGAYASMFGLDVTKPLNEQFVDEENGITWADDFMSTAKTKAQSVYALADAAEAAGFALSNEESTEIDYSIYNLETYATMYGYENADAFLRSRYGFGANTDSYLDYMKLCALAQAYQTHYGESLTYADADLRAVDSENYNNYSSYSFNSYYLSTNKFVPEGDDSHEAEHAAAEAAEAAAKAIVESGITTAEEFDAAIAALEVNEGTDAASTVYGGTLATSLNGAYANWVTDSSRKAGDMGYFASSTTATDGHADVSGYYIILFQGCDENTDPMVNVRHILVNFAGGTTDPNTGATIYSDAEKAAAKTAAEDLLKQWNEGDATEESFAELAKSSTMDPGSAENGGLYENVYPGQMVVNFNDWCFDDSRKVGDTGIVETEYGYHVMFFSGYSQKSYRDHLIETELRNADVSEWFNALLEGCPVTDGSFEYVNMDLVLSGGSAAESHEGHDHEGHDHD